MILLCLAGIPGLVFCAWLYMRVGPPRRFKDRIFFEGVVGLALCFGIALITCQAYATVAGTHDSAWWPVLGCIYTLGFVPVFLAFAAIIRMVVYRQKKEKEGVCKKDNQ